MQPLCRHCHQTHSTRPRGLCWTCYYTPGIRDLYPSTSKYAHRGPGNFCGRAPLPDAATAAEPGSEQKILVLMERASKRQALFHPDDARAAPRIRQNSQRPEVRVRRVAELRASA